MIQITINMNEPMPAYLVNWMVAHRARGMTWSEIHALFIETTGGIMSGIMGERQFDLIFEDDKKATAFLLEYS